MQEVTPPRLRLLLQRCRSQPWGGRYRDAQANRLGHRGSNRGHNGGLDQWIRRVVVLLVLCIPDDSMNTDLRCARARDSRDITVPIGMCNVSAIS